MKGQKVKFIKTLLIFFVVALILNAYAVKQFTLVPGTLETTVTNKTSKIYKITTAQIDQTGKFSDKSDEYTVEPDKSATITMRLTREPNFLWIERVARTHKLKPLSIPSENPVVKEAPVYAKITFANNTLQLSLPSLSPLAEVNQKPNIDYDEIKVSLKGPFAIKAQLILNGADLSKSTFKIV